MKAISLLQPWASLVVMGAKKIETRSWNTKYRGELLIHASAGKTKEGRNLAKYNSDFYDALKTEYDVFGLYDLPFGAIIGKVNLIDTVLIQTLFHMIVVVPDGLSSKEKGIWRLYGWQIRLAAFRSCAF